MGPEEYPTVMMLNQLPTWKKIINIEKIFKNYSLSFNLLFCF